MIRLFTILLIFSSLAGAKEQPPKAAIASAHYLATEAGHEILDAGGNAFDAAIAVSAALAVVEPTSSGIGGGGLWLLHIAKDNRDIMIDGREFAPGAAHRDMYLDEQGNVDRDLALHGPLAAGIPGEPAALAWLARKYGKLPLSESLAPAIRIADQGFPVYPKFRTLQKRKLPILQKYPASAAQFLLNNQTPPLDYNLKQPDLAATLRLMAQHGHDGFYKGEVARKLVKGVKEAGGIWTMEDLAAYQIVEREPIRTNYQGWELVTSAPPSSGGIVLATMLNILEPYDLESLDTAHRVHMLVEAMRRAYRDRSIYLGDSDFVPIPMDILLSKNYAAGLMAGIHPNKATPSALLPGPLPEAEGDHTTHFSLIDRDGNMVSATLTVNTSYGSGFIPPGTGVVLNNEMDDFSSKPGEPNAYGLIGAEANAIEPRKRMLSSMTPTFVHGEDRTAIIGTPGGSRIITMVFLGILDFMAGNGPESWVALPRFHHQYLPDVIGLEPDALDDETVAKLESMGHTVKRNKWTWGLMNGVMWDKKNQKVEAATDPRWPSGKAEIR